MTETKTRDEVETMLARAGRIPSVELFYGLHVAGALSPDAYGLVGSVWSMAEYPDRVLTRAQWLELFGEAGYRVDGEPADRPTEPLTLYRGAVLGRRLDWSWTADYGVALDFATGGIGGRPQWGNVWVAEIKPWRLLASNNERGESEFVVNTRGLKPRKVA